MAVRKCSTRAYRAESVPPRAQGRSPPRLEGEGQGGGVDKERQIEAIFVIKFRPLRDREGQGGGVDEERIGEVSKRVADFRIAI